jgi:uncharacterized protein (DUF736 family)
MEAKEESSLTFICAWAILNGKERNYMSVQIEDYLFSRRITIVVSDV